MAKQPIYDEAGDVSADDGVVSLDGPGNVHVQLTADAAEEISERLLTGALKARDPQYFEDRKARR